jgi:hypothetical protein
MGPKEGERGTIDYAVVSVTVLICDVVWEDHRQRGREDILWVIGFGAAEADFVSEHC